MSALFGLAFASYGVRVASRRLLKRAEESRLQTTFYWSHVLSASIAALATPLGIVYGWLIDPRLGSVIPFWVVPLTMGFLAIPRTRELDDFNPPFPNLGASPT